MLPHPASALFNEGDGVLITHSATAEKLNTAIEFIAGIGNVTLAKLYLDEVYKHQSLDVVLKKRTRLQGNIIALFDTAIEHIKQQPKHEADIALMAIAAAAEQEHGIKIVMLEEWMRDALSRLAYLARAPPRSLEDILRCANGYLYQATIDADNRYVTAYCSSFIRYIKENYNDTLFWYRSQLSIRRASKSLTVLHSTQPKLTSPPMVASPPSMDGNLDTVAGGQAGQRIQRSPPEYFDRSFKPGGFPFPPKPRTSLSTLLENASSQPNIKKLSPANRTYTLIPNFKRDVRSSTEGKKAEVIRSEADKPRISRSIHRPVSRVCSFCEIHIFGSGKLHGTYRRPYSSLNLLMVKRCIFCSILYKEILETSDVGWAKLHDTDSPTFSWSIRATAKSRESKNSMVVSFHRTKSTTENERDAALSGMPIDGTNPVSKVSTLLRQYPPQRFHLVSEDDLGHVPSRDDINPTTDPSNKAVGRQVIDWVDNCNKNHPKCIKAAKTTYVPTRLLDLQFGDLSHVRLVKTKVEDTKGPYVTLSHCWGKFKFLCTQGETEKEYMTTGVKISALSKNFQQAIAVARHIGIRYIWIDSLCIIQGAASDFATEGHLMHKVYRNSYCNFVAAVSVDSRGGLFRDRDPEDVLPGRYKGDGSSAIFEATTWRIVPEDLWESELLSTHIYTRGWVFQERMLSPRILHFTQNQVFWDCGTVSACESLPSGLPLPLDDSASTDRHWRGRLQESYSLAHAPLSGVNDDSLGGFWSSSVLRYTQCDLTDQVDKSLAIWSIAKLIRDAWGDEYTVGVWSLALEEQLSWKVVNMKQSMRRIDLQWRQPSWSWTSVQGAVSLPQRVKTERYYTIKGHYNEPIFFKTTEPHRPALKREHSDSVKEDVELGWKEWQKKTRMPSLPQPKRDNMGERSQSMPITQKVTDGEPVKLPHVEAEIDPRDLEPALESKSIAIKASLGAGTLHHNANTGSYTFKITTNAEIPPDTPIASQDLTLKAYPDDTPSPSTLSPHTLNFVFLTTTEHTTYLAPTGLGIDLSDSEYDSDNEPELPLQTTYSGTGLLLISTRDYLHQHHDFETEIGLAEVKLAKAVEAHRVAEAEKRDTGSKSKPTKAAEDFWVIKATKELVGLKEWVDEMRESGHWRRVGVVEFEGWSEEAYGRVMGGEMGQWWLD